MNEQLLEAKLKLYSELIKISESNLTDGELEIMFRLSCDKQVQDYLEMKK